MSLGWPCFFIRYDVGQNSLELNNSCNIGSYLIIWLGGFLRDPRIFKIFDIEKQNQNGTNIVKSLTT